ncbi:molybdopterin-guanine dinucleotide biosynthesis protein MobC [Candidatus Fukatsuia symbiotica]|uniref:Molybdopterin-guanine dinucleotide biosynthesis protein MobC n=1 Tax=Candidatus Fukatsuia symbiotica TaxID=1878942 RepID=A0A2U8I9A2_9GAMM|nr:molybdopterin-guanine dinucleotide biosynthesis protein MobC [Candidatus Fukatsuia symbiotica]AWK15697.1 molybdopterin-guanine dinucleotide biosynthesis protein MobC [Candidatus Fukatsuia symbiotica]MEA9446110.1 molybdopterin-guanine dinucleotide biosynthesis protein MobC [Candidatus Fukatsuia symbiotica]
MALKKYYTLEQLDSAKRRLEELPDLKKQRMTGDEMLKELKAQLVKLASDKGYEAADIKSVLDSVGIKIGLKPIKEIIYAKNLAKKCHTAEKKCKHHVT